jgi:hypothetical protein
MARPRKPEEDDGAPTTKRIQMDMAPASVARLHRLQRRTEAASYSETVRNALQVQERLLDALKDGGSLVVRNAGSETRILMICEDVERTVTPDASRKGSVK